MIDGLFTESLLKHEKWKDKNFVDDQLIKHLKEVLQLYEEKNDHLKNELVDLLNIILIHLRINNNNNEFEKITEQRFNKFMQKLKEDRE